MNILYITYIDFKDVNSGSSVRPQKIYETLVASGHNVKLLSGSQSNEMRDIRKKTFQTL